MFNQSCTPKEGKISYCLDSVQQYIPAPLRWFKCQKYGTPGKLVEWQTHAKCSEKNPDHLEEDCLKEIRHANCQQNHPAYPRSCNVYKKEKEILDMKHKRNVSFLEARKIEGTYMEANSYAFVAQRVDTTN